MQAAWVARFSQRSAMMWILGAVLVSAGAGVTTTAAALQGTTTMLSQQAVTLQTPALTGPESSPLPADWKPFVQLNDGGTSFIASVRAPYRSIVVINVPLKNAANSPQAMRLHLDVPEGFAVDAATAAATAAQFGNVVGDAGPADFNITLPAAAEAVVQLTVKMPALLGSFDLKATLDPLN